MINRVRRRLRRLANTATGPTSNEAAQLRASIDALALELRDLNATTTNGYRAAVDEIRAELTHGLATAASTQADFDQHMRAWVPEYIDALRAHLELHAGEAVDAATSSLQLRLRRVERDRNSTRPPRSGGAPAPADTSDTKAHPLPGPASASYASLELNYSAFEDELRGSPDHVKRLESVHVSTIEGFGADGLPVLDVGCGRGELLQLLQDAGIAARGVDLNPVSVADCIADGLDVVEGDAVALLRSLPPSSLRAVVGLHIVEHMTESDRAALFAAAHTALADGGGLIVETPNPENLRVGATTFWLDPTHLRPVPPQLLAFQVRESGFDEVDIQRLHPTDNAIAIPADADPLAAELGTLLNQLVSGPQDYAVIGRKSAGEQPT